MFPLFFNFIQKEFSANLVLKLKQKEKIPESTEFSCKNKNMNGNSSSTGSHKKDRTSLKGFIA